MFKTVSPCRFLPYFVFVAFIQSPVCAQYMPTDSIGRYKFVMAYKNEYTLEPDALFLEVIRTDKRKEKFKWEYS